MSPLVLSHAVYRVPLICKCDLQKRAVLYMGQVKGKNVLTIKGLCKIGADDFLKHFYYFWDKVSLGIS